MGTPRPGAYIRSIAASIRSGSGWRAREPLHPVRPTRAPGDSGCRVFGRSPCPASSPGAHLWTIQRCLAIFCGVSKGKNDLDRKADVLQGTLDLMILKTLQAMGPLHGFGIARRLEQ